MAPVTISRTMKIQYGSDLHLEFRENTEYLEENPLQPEGSILLLAGDIVPFAFLEKHAGYLDLLSGQFESVYWIPGNHEYYHSDISSRSGSFMEKIRDNVFLLNSRTIAFEGVRLIFSTLWSRISTIHQHDMRRGMADFQLISNGKEPFSTANFNHLHHEARDFVTRAIEQPFDGKTIVVTHHVPTLLNYPEKYLGDALNEAFAVELAPLIESSGVDYWIYGHHHQAIPEFTIGTTKLITNQLGYVRYGEHVGFRRDAVIEV